MLSKGQAVIPEVQLFAAQTLCHKVRRQLSSLSDQDAASLREKLIDCLAAASLGPMSVLSQLCTAMAYLMVQRPATDDPLGSFGRVPCPVDAPVIKGFDLEMKIFNGEPSRTRRFLLLKAECEE